MQKYTNYKNKRLFLVQFKINEEFMRKGQYGRSPKRKDTIKHN